MLRSVNDFKSYVLAATDGDIGRCKDLFFDDEAWAIRYMVADTRKWLPGRKVLISPISPDAPDRASGRFPVRLTQAQVRDAPSLDEDAPVSRQHERHYTRHYNWPACWDGPGTWAGVNHATSLFEQPLSQDPSDIPVEGDSHLRSIREVIGYSLKNKSEELGLVHDLIAEDDSWRIRHLVVDTGSRLPGRKVLIPVEWIDTISWKDRVITTQLRQDAVKSSPPFDPAAPVNEGYTREVFDFYGRPAARDAEAKMHAVAR